jgi:hypothetical protein
MNDIPGSHAFDAAIAAAFSGALPLHDASGAIGYVSQIAGGRGELMLDAAMLAALQADVDPTLAMAGQVGGQVKARVGATWLIATIRALRLEGGPRDPIVAKRFMPPPGAPRSRSAPFTPLATSALRSTSTRCSASISRCWVRPEPASRPPPR